MGDFGAFIYVFPTTIERAETLKRLIFWSLLISLLFVPMIVAFVHAPDIARTPLARRLFGSESVSAVLTDILFIEGVAILLLGVCAWAFVTYEVQIIASQVGTFGSGFNFARVYSGKKAYGIVLIAVGIVYILVAILAPSNLVPII